VKIDWKSDLQDPVRRDFDGKASEALLSARGIGNDDTVVLYGGNNNWFAAYAYWYFRLYGHQNTKLLDGGRKKWELDSASWSPRCRSAPPPATRPGPGHRDPRVPRRGHRRDRPAELVDVRSPTSSAGRLLARPPAPGAGPARRPSPPRRTCPGPRRPRRDGTFKSDDALRTLYGDEAGVDFGKDTIAYCRIGERSAHTWFVLHELLGQANVKNYDGSWTEYGSLVGVPIEVGDGQ
jgi:thiosulfate/3-mercaptopyruvate sulfurtransferase